MIDKVKQAYQAKKIQADLQKILTSITGYAEKNGNSVVVNGEKKIVKLVINGVENKALVELINSAMKEADKKAEKEMVSKREELGKLLGIA